MPVEKTEREIGALIAEISRDEIKLPEIQRGYVELDVTITTKATNNSNK